MSASDNRDSHKRARAMAARLLRWYGSNARQLPWRNPPRAPLPDDPDWPYRVWISEVMLQQTTVEAVAPRYRAFLERWPDLDALARASEAEVMAAWAGLGYYSRARNLHRAARRLAKEGGRLPAREAELRKLPGFGEYTAAAVAAFGFGERAVVVDANVARVAARLDAIDRPLAQARKPIRALVEQMTPKRRAGDFAQAMMDLGAMVCRARDPQCARCVLRADCRAAREGRAQEIPLKPARREKPLRRGAAYWIEHEGALFLRRRARTGLLGAMRGLPDDGWSAARDGDGCAPLAGEWRQLGTLRHVFSHARLDLELRAYVGRVEREEVEARIGPGEWWPIDALASAGLPSLFARAARLAQKSLEVEPSSRRG